MADITRLPTAPGAGLTSGHRFLMYAIQDLCLDITLRCPELFATYEYHGITHELMVVVTARTPSQGCLRWSTELYLPPGKLAPRDSLQALGNIITKLEQYLPGGAA